MSPITGGVSGISASPRACNDAVGNSDLGVGVEEIPAFCSRNELSASLVGEPWSCADDARCEGPGTRKKSDSGCTPSTCRTRLLPLLSSSARPSSLMAVAFGTSAPVLSLPRPPGFCKVAGVGRAVRSDGAVVGFSPNPVHASKATSWHTNNKTVRTSSLQGSGGCPPGPWEDDPRRTARRPETMGFVAPLAKPPVVVGPSSFLRGRLAAHHRRLPAF